MLGRFLFEGTTLQIDSAGLYSDTRAFGVPDGRIFRVITWKTDQNANQVPDEYIQVQPEQSNHFRYTPAIPLPS